MAATPTRVSGRVRSQQPADSGVFLSRIQAALVAGSASDFLALGTLKPDVPEVRAFLDRWFVAGPPPPSCASAIGCRFAVARGSHSSSRLWWGRTSGRLATWRIDLTQANGSWQIAGAATLSVVEGLFRLSLSQGDSSRLTTSS